MRSIPPEELKLIQLDILDILHSYCREQGLRYTISNGTLIGSVKFGGYIPWDDDIDVTMPRDDYQRLLDCFPELFKGHYRLGSLDRNPHWDRFYAKLYDDRTLMRENRRDGVETGVNIDIFPADAVPEEDGMARRWFRRRLLIHRIFELKERKLFSPRAWWKTLLLIPAKLLLLPFGKRMLCEAAEREAVRWNGADSPRLSSLVSGYHLTGPFSASAFDSLEKTDFEGHECLRFASFDEYLRAGYGDYTQMPPAERQVSHHRFSAFYKE